MNKIKKLNQLKSKTTDEGIRLTNDVKFQKLLILTNNDQTLTDGELMVYLKYKSS